MAITNEWGFITIELTNLSDIEYKHGKLISPETLEELPCEILNRKVDTIKAHGGWTRMDYMLTLENP